MQRAHEAVTSSPHPASRAQAWVTQPERGSLWLLRVMSAVSLRCGRAFSRLILVLIVGYFWLLPGEVAGHIARYQRRVLPRRPTGRSLFSHLLTFATCLHDRAFLLNDRLTDFSVELTNEDLLKRTLEHKTGCMLMGAHFGSFEVLRAIGRQHPDVDIVMAMYAENARKIGAVLAAINPHAVPEIIPLGSIDAMLRIRKRLDQGAFVGVLGDRTLADETVLTVNFLGAPAQFPVGPWRAAALLRRPVLFIAGVYCGGNRYRIIVEPLADFSETDTAKRDIAIHEAMMRYAGMLEVICRAHPYNWFNFFDFWHELPRDKAA